MQSKEYKLPNGKKAVFEYDVCGIGKITLECMDELMGMIADRPQGWIPCSERLPKAYVEVLVCDDFGWINLGAYRPCDVSEDCSGWSIHAHTKIGTEEVIAWMPLPKPWEGADDDSDNI